MLASRPPIVNSTSSVVAAQASAALEKEPAAIEGLLTTATLENGVRHVVTELEWLGDLRRDLDDVPVGTQRMRQRLYWFGATSAKNCTPASSPP